MWLAEIGSVIGFVMWIYALIMIYKGWILVGLIIYYVTRDSPPKSFRSRAFAKVFPAKKDSEPERNVYVTDFRGVAPHRLARGSVLPDSVLFNKVATGEFIPRIDGRELRLYYPPTHRVKVYFRIGDSWMYSNEYVDNGRRPHRQHNVQHTQGRVGVQQLLLSHQDWQEKSSEG
jgi:hypothetical protein